MKKHLTYYHVKDINWLSHERVLDKFRDIKTHMKKIKKSKARNEEMKTKKLVKQVPTYNLNHLVKER